MSRTLKAAALMLAATTLGAPEAHAIEEAHMWGVGAKLGTTVLPGRFPLAYPSKIANYDFIDEGPQAGATEGDNKNRDLDENGNPIFSTLERVRWDGQFSVDAFYGIDAKNRIGAMAGLGGGTGYSDVYFMLHYDRRLLTESDIDLLAGAYAGFGQMTFKAPDDGPEKLRVPHFPIRGRLMAQLRAKTTAYGLGLYAGTNIPSNHFYTDVNGLERDDVASPFNLFLYMHAGIEFSFQYGDFTAPKKKKKNKGKKGKGKK